MDFIISNQKRLSVKLQRLLMIMVAIIVASMTITACLEDENGEDPDDNGNSGGGVAGKRLKGYEQTSSKPEHYLKMEYSYNSDGTLNRVNQYDKASTLVQYFIYTNNPDGTLSRMVLKNENYETVYEYFYNSNKTLQKAQVLFSGILYGNIEYTFENGKKTREMVRNISSEMTQLFEYSYDNRGRRTTTTETNYIPPNTRQYTRTYNSDGTLQKVTFAYGYGDNTPVTIAFTWENGKSTYNHDDFAHY